MRTLTWEQATKRASALRKQWRAPRDVCGWNIVQAGGLWGPV